MPPAPHAAQRWEPPAAPSRGPRLLTAAAVGMLAAVLFARLAAGPDPGLPVEPEPPAPTPDVEVARDPLPWQPQDGQVGTWAMLPEPPIRPRANPVVVWTGAGTGLAPRARGELLVWGGHVRLEGFADGAAYDPFAGTWRRLPDAPKAWRQGSTVVATWTGDELVTLLRPTSEAPAAGLAYDPSVDRWRETAPPPAGGAWQAAGWSGEEMVVLPATRSPDSQQALAYDPDADRWRSLPRPPVVSRSGALVTAGLAEGLGVFGEAAHRPAATLLAPDADAWSGPDPLPARSTASARPLLASDAADPAPGPRPARAHGDTPDWAEPVAGGWGALPELGARANRATLAWGGGRFYAWFGDGATAGAVFDPAHGRWRPMAPPPLAPRRGAGVAWTGRALVVWGGSRDGEPLGDGAAFLPWSGLSDGRLRTGR